MAIIQEPWGEKEQLRHAAICTWPKMIGRRTEHLRLCQDLQLLGYDGMVASMSAQDIINGWIKSGWVVRSPNGVELRVTKAGESQLQEWNGEDGRWDEGGAAQNEPEAPAGAKTEAQLLAQVTDILKDQYRERDVRNAAVSTWRHIIDRKGGQAAQWDFVNSIKLMAVKEPGRVLSPVEILTEWQTSGWVEHSPDGSEIRVTPSGVEKLREWEEENRRWKTREQGESNPGELPQTPQNEATTASARAALIHSLLEDVSKLPTGDNIKLDALRKRAKLIITKVFDDRSHYTEDLESIKFHAATYQQAVKPGLGEKSWQRGTEKFKNLCNTMLEDLALPSTPAMTKSQTKSNRIFVVHGHDNEMKQAVARTVEKLGFEAVILHEQVNKGAPTLMEKLLQNSDASFAVILLSPDDVGYPKDTPDKARPRPRQNVVFEFGLFVGKLGRENVFVLHRRVPDFEMLSDFAGGVYQEFDDAGAWRYELGRELKAAGYNIDLNKLGS
ncbi:MAG TPA: nucleotide-binding protein [Candidatus Acidoferrum sp.]|jgi:predicted nucleotide-binding protein|nr:nucleotide-binding protein [Candidatus Acidoferrum sp.]